MRTRGPDEYRIETFFEMTHFHLTALSVSVLFLLHHSLKRIFFLIEKAHEHLRETEPRTPGVELVGRRGD